MKNTNKSTKRAFTLIELLIVIAIIGILFVVLVSKVDFATDKAKATGVQTDFRSFQMAFETVSKENAGFASLGWDTGDENGNRKRDSYDEGDTNKNNIMESTETWTGHKVPGENWTGTYTLVNPDDDTDKSAFKLLEDKVNANLDPKLHITITPEENAGVLTGNAKVTMANAAKDPWKNEYHGVYITNALNDKGDRGAFIIYSNGANGKWGSEHDIADGKVSIIVPGNNINGKDDMSIVVCYTYENGYGETDTSTGGFSNNQGFLSGNLQNIGTIHLVVSGSTYYASAPAALTFKSSINKGDVLHVYVNNILLSEELYDVNDNMVSLSIDYLSTLESGEYNISIEYESVKLDGKFNVYIPELNEYGFFYNQPYSAYVPYLDSTVVFFIRDNNTLDAMALDISEHRVRADGECSNYTIDGNTMTIESASLGTLHLYLDGETVYNPELDTVFSLGSEAVVADNDYFYIYNQYQGGYYVAPVDKTKDFYPAIQSGVNGIDTIGIASHAFGDAKNMQYAPEIPDTVVAIGVNAFADCWNMKSITLPESLVLIDEGAFEHCQSLTSITLPQKTECLSYRCFSNCLRLETFVIPSDNNLQEIYDYAFDRCSSLREISLPDNVMLYGSAIFASCYSLKQINLSTAKVDNIHNGLQNMFNNCYSLESVVLPEIQNLNLGQAFYNCYSLKSLHIPMGASFSGITFNGCTSLNSITTDNYWYKIENDAIYSADGTSLIYYFGNASEFYIGPNVTTIDEYAFANNQTLKEIVVDSSNSNYKSIDGILYDRYNKLMRYPAAKVSQEFVLETQFYSSAFKHCTKLDKLVLNNNAERVDWALCGSGIKEFEVIGGFISSVDGYIIDEHGNLGMVGVGYGSTVIVPGIDTVYESACSQMIGIEKLVFSNGTTCLYCCSVYGNMDLKTVVLPKTLTFIGEEAFMGCINLQTIIYEGTMEEWKLVELDRDWNHGVPAQYVQCSDGLVAIELN